ncbi:MAG: E3 binding domain-containing protein, partial [Alphaproteobacteria bacterium]|nr:E3 binding domain-containing protein [Alphaproteobacteria bacterium]
MAINILMPALSPTMTEGKLAKWHVKEGDKVTSGKVICEIETDKATMEVEAVDEGIVGRILIAEGTEAVKVNAPIAILIEEGEAVPTAAAPAAAASNAPPAAAPAAKPAAPAAGPSPAPGIRPTAPVAAPSGGNRLCATPLARRIAADAGIDLGAVTGSGPHGRIVKGDIEAAQKSGATKAATAPKAAPSPAAPPPPVFPAGETRKVPHSSVRKVIARRMQESKQQIPHIYLTVDYEIDALLAARQAINAVGEKSK